MKPDASIANLGWLAASLPAWRRFRRDAEDIEATQRSQLSHYLAMNKGTVFGRDHGFETLRCYEDFASAVPLRCYDDFEPLIRRIASGEENVLTAEPVKLLEPSSGSSGAEKWIPYTKTLQGEFNRSVAVWMAQNFLDDPRLIGGRAYWSLTPRIPRDENAGTVVPVGFDEDSAYLGGFAERLIRRTLLADPALARIRDMPRFWRATLVSLLACRDLRLISVWHPSFLQLLLERMRSEWRALLDGVRHGMCDESACFAIRGNKRRADELRSVGCDDLAYLWPQLRLISCWGDANATAGFDEVESEFPGVRVQRKGLVATEAIATLPFSGHRPLAISSHFFEFEAADGSVKPSWAAEEGEEYSLVVTTGGGLYRYRMKDRVRVVNRYGSLPSLVFLGKEDSVTDFFGEKLSEAFIVDVLEKLFRRMGVRPGFAMLAYEPELACYTLFVEADRSIATQADNLDSGLRENPHYALCRQLGQLHKVRISTLPGNAVEAYTNRLVERGMRLGDIKLTALSRDTDWSRYLCPARVA